MPVSPPVNQYQELPFSSSHSHHRPHRASYPRTSNECLIPDRCLNLAEVGRLHVPILSTSSTCALCALVLSVGIGLAVGKGVCQFGFPNGVRDVMRRSRVEQPDEEEAFSPHHLETFLARAVEIAHKTKSFEQEWRRLHRLVPQI